MQMEIFMMENGKMIKQMVKELLSMRTELDMKVR